MAQWYVFYSEGPFGARFNGLTRATGSEALLWPQYVDAEYMDGWDCSSSESRLYDPKCPSSGFLPIYQHFYNWWNIPQLYPIQIELHDYSIRKIFYGVSSPNQDGLTTAYTTHLATAMLQDAMRDQYLAALAYLKHEHPYTPPGPNYLDVAESMKFEVDTKVPTVRTSCLVNENVTIIDQELRLNFSVPIVEQDTDYSSMLFLQADIDVTDIIQQYLLDSRVLEASEDGLAFTNQVPAILCIPIALAPNMTEALGLVILKDIGDSMWAASTCTVHTLWEPATSVIESTEDNNRLSHEHWADRIVNVVRTEKGENKVSSAENSRVIRIDPSWYELLSPRLSDSAVFGEDLAQPRPDRSTIERLLEVMLLPKRIPGERGNVPGGLREVRGVEHMLATYFADGLSRCGAQLHPQASRLLEEWEFGDWSVHNVTQARMMVRRGGPPPFTRPTVLTAGGWNSTRMEMRAVFTGYVIAAIDWFDYLSIGLLLLHIIIALSHTVHVLCTRQTSEAWDSVSELVALSQMSPPPTGRQLASSCAGIRTFGTMGRVAVVEAHETAVATRADVQLRFRDPACPRDTNLFPEPGKKYG